MIIGSETILWVWYDIELMKTHRDHAEKINTSTKIERKIEFPMYASKWTQINKTSVHSMFSLSCDKQVSVN